ncbi:sensor histidine kinase [Vulcaniibacterium thermophilum]|uniref:sensor histidine kinase n=1 Tax=Vulcaniibacterium thermophilum TaxID=1169913 RepID=UPI0011B85CB3|nr:histidine kinase [Vulcaniibacterium thermophilum]
MRRVPWLLVVGVIGWWALNGLISTVQVVAVLASRGQPVVLPDVLRSELASAALWVPCTLWLLWWVARAPLERERWAAPFAWLLFAVLVVAAFRAVAVPLLEPWVGWRSLPRTAEVMLATSLRNVLTGLLIVGVGHALVYAQRSRARERQAQALQEQLTRARLDALSAQLNPHFLFNALNSIAEMVHHDVDAADRMLVQLGGLLRHSLAATRQQHTSLREELGIVDCYIGIEQVRLGDRLRFRREVAPEVLHAQVPRLMLQPLVENAITHAVAHRDAPSTVAVRAARDGDRLVLEVLDDGAGAPPRPGFGVGLANTRARLECLYGQAQALDIATLPGGGTRVRVSLPLVTVQAA